MIVHIKNMVCRRCIQVVTQLFTNVGIQPLQVNLGEVILKEDVISAKDLAEIDSKLAEQGFERIDDRKTRIIEQIKVFAITQIHKTNEDADIKTNWSTALSEHLHYDYNYLSILFSSVEGITIEQFIIRQKVERVKELLVYDELSLSQIAAEMGYSSVAHLSNQFKKTTGFTPTAFKNNHKNSRKPLDEV